MNNHAHTDPFTYHVLQRIDPKVRASLTPAQFSAIEEAVTASQPLKKHPIDVRGVIPIFFAHYYFVFLMGRDRRVAIRRMEWRRKKLISVVAEVSFFVLAFSPFLLLVILFFYILKCAAGIDIMADVHLEDMFKFW